METKNELENSLVRKISGLRPLRTGGICDICNRGFKEGDKVNVLFEKWNGQWVVIRTQCADTCQLDLSDRKITEAVVRCELGPRSGDSFPLYNPEVVELDSESGPELRR